LVVSWLAYSVELFLAYSVMQLFAFPRTRSGNRPTTQTSPALPAPSTLPGWAIRLHQACPIHGDRAGAEPGRKIFVETFRSLVEHQRRSFSLIELFKLDG